MVVSFGTKNAALYLGPLVTVAPSRFVIDLFLRLLPLSLSLSLSLSSAIV